MRGTDAPPRAVGRLGGGEAWVGFEVAAGVPRLVFGTADGRVVPDPTDDPEERRRGLVAVATAYFTDALPEPPESLAATHADMATLIRGLRAFDRSPAFQRAVAEAEDAIDDGLAGDAVALRLQALGPEPPVDALDVLEERLRLAAAGGGRGRGSGR